MWKVIGTFIGAIAVLSIFMGVLANVTGWWDARTAKADAERLVQIKANAAKKRAEEFPAIKGKLLQEATEVAKTDPIAALHKLSLYSHVADADLAATLTQLKPLAAKAQEERDKKAAEERRVAAENALRATHSKECDNAYSAHEVAKITVTAFLKAPSTASFQRENDLRNLDIDMKRKYIKSAKLPTDACLKAAVVTVDAQNSFGAMLRSSYAVVMYLPLRENANWQPLDIIQQR